MRLSEEIICSRSCRVLSRNYLFEGHVNFIFHSFVRANESNGDMRMTNEPSEIN